MRVADDEGERRIFGALDAGAEASQCGAGDFLVSFPPRPPMFSAFRTGLNFSVHAHHCGSALRPLASIRRAALGLERISKDGVLCGQVWDLARLIYRPGKTKVRKITSRLLAPDSSRPGT